jgi:hypothetical protein
VYSCGCGCGGRLVRVPRRVSGSSVFSLSLALTSVSGYACVRVGHCVCVFLPSAVSSQREETSNTLRLKKYFEDLTGIQKRPNWKVGYVCFLRIRIISHAHYLSMLARASPLPPNPHPHPIINHACTHTLPPILYHRTFHPSALSERQGRKQRCCHRVLDCACR